MNIKMHSSRALLILMMSFVVAAFLYVPRASAQACFINPSNAGGEATSVECPEDIQTSSNSNKCFYASLNTPDNFREKECPPGYTTEQQEFKDNDCDNVNLQANVDKDDPRHCGILNYVVLGTNLLSALVGIVVIGSIVYGGIQYSMAGGDPQKIAAAKERIRNAIIALIAFIFTYSFLNYMIPGGLL